MKIISAMTPNGIIGVNGVIPWYLPEDLQKYKKQTTNNFIVVGRKTYEGLPICAKKNRDYIVLSKTFREYEIEPYKQFNDVISLNLFLRTLEEKETNKNIYIGGGSKIYEMYVGIADEILLTYVHVDLELNLDDKITKFPYTLIKTFNYVEVLREKKVSKTGIIYENIKYEKK